ncbi:transglutaminase [Rhodnius prolixus]
MPVECCPPSKIMYMFRRTPKPRRRQDWPRNPAPIVGKDTLQIVSVDPCLRRNGFSHRTGMFDLMTTNDDPQLVVRRGQPFVLELTLSRPYNQETDSISFIFYHKLATYPSFGRKTMVTMPLLVRAEVSSENIWSAELDNSNGNKISVFISTPADTIIGKWKMEIDCMVKKEGSNNYKYKKLIYILFNAWCKDDAVFIDGAANRKEYVITEVGSIWKGSFKKPHSSLWKYGQFDKDVLDCSLYLLEKVSKLPLTQYNDPVMVSRAVSSAVNSPDDNGVVYGNWSEDFSGGNKPSEWIGSPKILRKYYKTQKPVKYGQCYVFAGVTTTVFRALGIPSRTVTCYKSAHDYGCSHTIDIFIDDNGEILSEFSKDLIWNYHVWSEMWTKRPDLEPGYDGWQVVDGTPQELSDNLYRCGPAPVVAIKRGDVKKPYDVAYVFSEVNADVIYWKFQGLTQPLKLIQSDTIGVGQFISTKAVGSYEREDLTDQYKYREKSREERLTMLKALRTSEHLNSRYYLNESFNDVKFEFQLQDDITIGNSYSIYLTARNVSMTNHNVSIILRSATQNYHGEIISIIKREEKKLAVAADSEERAVMVLNYADYSSYLSNDIVYQICALCKVEGTDFEYFAQDDFRIVLPTITIKLESTPVANKVLYGSAFFKNPLPDKLKNCVFLIEGPGLKKGLKYKIEDVPANSMAKVNFKMTPTFYGKQTIVAKFNSSNLNNVDGYLTVVVDEGNMNRNDVNTIN